MFTDPVVITPSPPPLIDLACTLYPPHSDPHVLLACTDQVGRLSHERQPITTLDRRVRNHRLEQVIDFGLKVVNEPK